MYPSGVGGLFFFVVIIFYMFCCLPYVVGHSFEPSFDLLDATGADSSVSGRCSGPAARSGGNSVTPAPLAVAMC